VKWCGRQGKSINKYPQVSAEHAGGWINAILHELDGLDEKTKVSLLEKTGRYCAECHSMSAVKRIVEETEDVQERLNLMKERMHFPEIKVKGENPIESISLTYPKMEQPCICPLVQYGVVELNPTLCECTKGWVKANMEVLLEQPVKVTIEKTAARGDDTCRFTVYPKNS
jgi:predicted hydrocarbon binding protein